MVVNIFGFKIFYDMFFDFVIVMKLVLKKILIILLMIKIDFVNGDVMVVWELGKFEFLIFIIGFLG